MSTLRVALGQMNPHVGNLAGNVARLGELYDQAEAAGCDLVAFPELAVPGYPSEDLLIRRGFLEDNVEALDRVVARTGRCVALQRGKKKRHKENFKTITNKNKK